MQPIDVLDPPRWSAMHDFCQIRERGFPEVKQVLPLEITFAPLARDGRDERRAMVSPHGPRPADPLTGMLDSEAARDDPYAGRIEIQRPRDPDRLRRHGIRMRVM